MSATDNVRALVQPIVASHDVELYDLEHESGVLRVVVDREGGIDVDTIGDLAKEISDVLDREDPITDSKYLLEVTSPGIERKLRTPEHFRRQTGAEVSVKFRSLVNGIRRTHAVVVAADESGVEFLLGEEQSPVHVRYDDIEIARTVFDWASQSGDTRQKAHSAASHQDVSESPLPNQKDR